MRAALRIFLKSHEFASVLEEFWVPISHERADLVLIDSGMHGFEIKTAQDTLRRLPRQALAYGRIFDRCTLVVAERHVQDGSKVVPPWWGILAFSTVGDAPVFHWARSAGVNPTGDAITLVRLLWRREARTVLESLGITAGPAQSRGWMWNELLKLADAERLKPLIRQAIVNRARPLANGPVEQSILVAL